MQIHHLDKQAQVPSRSGSAPFALGRQLTIEYYECAPQVLVEQTSVEQALVSAARKSGATIVSSSFHQFSPQGVSGVVIIAESHFTVHAWPEHDYAAVDIFTCGEQIDLDVAITTMARAFGSSRVEISSDRNRGVLPEGRSDAFTPADHPDRVPISWKGVWEERSPWGVLTSVDLHGCDPGIIQDPVQIQAFARALCDHIGETPLNGCRIVPSEATPTLPGGCCMTQVTAAALISGHFICASGRAYIDLVCNRFYEPRAVAEFSRSFFRGDHYKMQVALRQ